MAKLVSINVNSIYEFDVDNSIGKSMKVDFIYDLKFNNSNNLITLNSSEMKDMMDKLNSIVRTN